MTRRILSIAAALGAAGLLTGCADPSMQPVAVAPVPTAATCGFQVVNNSSVTVRNLNFSSSALSNWGADQLGAAVLPPGRAASFRPNNPGNYDFRVIWMNGRSAELRQVNPCRSPSIIVTNAGLVAR